MRPIAIALFLLPTAAASASEMACIAPAAPLEPASACQPVPAFVIGPEVMAPYGCPEARVFFVDFPVHGEAPTEGFGDALREELLPLIEQIGPALCREADCDPACHTAVEDGLDLRVEPVFGEQLGSLVLRRREGHLRHWRLTITSTESADPITIAPPAHCAVVDALRTAASTVAANQGVDPMTIDALRVGREHCAVAPMGSGVACSLEPLPAAPWSGDEQNPHATVALVDTGVDVGLFEALAITHQSDAVRSPSLADSGDTHLHGAGMGELIRRIVPPESAELASYRVMSDAGHGVVADAARAVDDAATKLSGPTVINLSLGWMPERARPRRLFGYGCATREDDIGEAMRYALAVAADADSPERPVVVVAAAGNRPLSGENPDAFEVMPGPGFDPWTADWWTPNLDTTREPMLMPAQYARLDGSVVPVGAVDGADRRGALSVMPPEAEPHLTAPGQMIPLSSLAASDPDMTTLSGSSLAAAFTSAAIARALDAIHDRRLVQPATPKITGAEAAAFVYLVAEDLGRTGADGHPIRRVAIDRLDAALACQDLPAVLTCVANHQRDRGELLAHCGFAGTTCELEPSPPCRYSPGEADDCEQPLEMTVVEADLSVTRWRDGLGAPMRFGDPMTDGVPGRIDRALVGGVGPTPEIPPCSDCTAVFASTIGQVMVHMQMTTGYPSSTLFHSPELLVYDATGRKAAIDIDMGASAVSPGASLWAFGPGAPTTLGPVVAAILVMTIEQSGHPPAVGYSVVDVP